MAKQCFVCLRNINLLHASHFQFIFCHCSAFVWQGRIFPIYFIISQNCFLHLCCIAHLYLYLCLYFAHLYITMLQQFHYECSSTMANMDKGWWYKFCIFVIFFFFNLTMASRGKFIVYHMSSARQYENHLFCQPKVFL